MSNSSRQDGVGETVQVLAIRTGSHADSHVVSEIHRRLDAVRSRRQLQQVPVLYPAEKERMRDDRRRDVRRPVRTVVAPRSWPVSVTPTLARRKVNSRRMPPLRAARDEYPDVSSFFKTTSVGFLGATMEARGRRDCGTRSLNTA